MKTMMKRTACLNTSYHWVGLLESLLAHDSKLVGNTGYILKVDRFIPLVDFQEENVEVDDKGRIVVNGKVLTDAALEQRLRRFTTPKKGGKLKSGQEVKDQFDDLSKRADLIQLFKEARLNKDRVRPYAQTKPGVIVDVSNFFLQYVACGVPKMLSIENKPVNTSTPKESSNCPSTFLKFPVPTLGRPAGRAEKTGPHEDPEGTREKRNHQVRVVYRTANERHFENEQVSAPFSNYHMSCISFIPFLLVLKSILRSLVQIRPEIDAVVAYTAKHKKLRKASLFLYACSHFKHLC